jgi:uncharacterized protein
VTTLDTSAVFALLNRKDADHLHVTDVLRMAKPLFYIPTGILAEITYLIEQRLGHNVLMSFLSDVRNSNFVLYCGDLDLPRVEILIERYKDLLLGFADAIVIACAERRGGRVLSLDKHFWVVANENTLVVAR